MNPTEIIVREMQRNGSLECGQFLRKCQRQAIQSLQGKPHAQIISLNEACANAISLRLTSDRSDIHSADFRWAVPSRAWIE